LTTQEKIENENEDDDEDDGRENADTSDVPS
jgi:hypothetical protein